MARVSTVAVWDPLSGRRIINASDYDPEQHELYEDQGGPSPDPEQAPEPEVDDPVYRLEQNGPWWSIIGPDGEKVGKSHRSEEEARQALSELITDDA